VSDYLYGKRLKVYLNETIRVLKRFNEFKIDEEAEEKLMKISPVTIDRFLKNEKMKFRIKVRSLTKPGILLKHSILMRTFADWNEKVPGSVEVNLVGHEGGILKREFLYSLDVTDVNITQITEVSLSMLIY
jgi:hypothetical protein